MPAIERVITLLIGFALGSVLGWLWRASRRVSVDPALESELRSQVAVRETELAAIRAAAMASAAAQSSAEASLRAAEASLAEERELHHRHRAECTTLRTELTRAQSEAITGRAEAEANQRLLAEQRRTHEEIERELRETQVRLVQELKSQHQQALEELRTAFKALSSDALRQSAPEFLRLAGEVFGRFQESAKGDLSTREQRIETLVRPLEEHLKAYQSRLAQSEGLQSSLLGQLRQQLDSLAHQSQSLSTETGRLRAVLSNNQARGRWGEETLRRVVETAGMSVHCDFVEQIAEGEGRPDLLVQLPGNRCILIDSKVPELDAQHALASDEPARRPELLAQHVARVRTAIKSLSERDYPRQFPQALDHVILFLPAESLFSSALEGDPELIVWAADRKILLATPASLIGLLRGVSISWQQHEQSENAREIAAAARQLYERVVKFLEHFERLREGIQRTARAYDDAVGSYDRMVRPSGERLLKLGGANEERPLPNPQSLELHPRAIPIASTETPPEPAS